MTELLLATELGSEQRELARVVQSSGEALLDIINDILDFSKIEAGKIELEAIEFEPRVVVDGVSDLLGVRAHEKGIELGMWIADDVPSWVRGDPGRFRQILVNIVGNAIKFTSKGHVYIRVQGIGADEKNTFLQIEVRDTGIGIPKDRMDLLFRSFTQVDSSTTRKFGGTGLGLAISKRLVESMGGAFAVESVPGQGSAFRFSIKVGTIRGTQGPRSAGLQPFAGLRLLIVDDNEVNRWIFRDQLHRWGATCVEVEGAAAATIAVEEALAQDLRFDAAILDYQMPGEDGVSLARRLKRDARTTNMPLILATSIPDKMELDEPFEHLFRARLTKPIKQTSLRQAVSDAMSSASPALAVASTPAPAAIRTHATRVLVVEDNPVNQKVAVKMLARFGFACDVAENGLVALQALDAKTYDLILMDCQMPEMDGYEATAAIRKRADRSRQTKIVAMTASAINGDRERCLAAGMDDYVTKPLVSSALEALLERHVR